MINVKFNNTIIAAPIATKTIAILTASMKELMEGAKAEVKLSMGSPGPREPSSPGRPPHRQTDTFYESVYAKVKTLGYVVTGNLGSDDEKSIWLEYGTRNMEWRPSFRPAFNKLPKTTILVVKRNFSGIK